MKPPRAPKPLGELPAKHGRRLPEARARGFPTDGRYGRRDRLRHRDPSRGLGHEE